MPSLQIVPPASVTEAREGGEDFGSMNLALSRPAFEQELSGQLLALEELLAGDAMAVEAIAGFDQGAWDAWEIGKG